LNKEPSVFSWFAAIEQGGHDVGVVTAHPCLDSPHIVELVKGYGGFTDSAVALMVHYTLVVDGNSCKCTHPVLAKKENEQSVAS